MNILDFKGIEWIFFDLGGVLIDESLAMKIRKEADLKIIQSFGVEISLSDLEEKWSGEASAMPGDLDRNIFSIFLGNENLVSEALEKLKEEKKSWPSHGQRNVVKKEAKEVLEKLSQKFKLGIIANQPTFIRKMLEDAKIIGYFSFLGISNEYDLHKPDPEFFKKVLADCGADAKKSIFIDDNIQRGILPAKKLGFKTVWFNNDNRGVTSENYDFEIRSLSELLEGACFYMKRILILGSVGSGKSTLAGRLHEKLKIPVFCLDQYFWKPNWQKTDDVEWRQKVEKLSESEQWIMDGNFSNTLDIRLPKADTVIFIDCNRFLCLWRFVKRVIGKRDYGAINGCQEKINLKMLIWILWKFPQYSGKEIFAEIEKVKSKKNVFILKSNREIEEFLSKFL